MYNLRDPHAVKLTKEQRIHGVKVGKARQEHNANVKANDRYGYGGNTAEGDKIAIAGALGEKAVAVALNVPWGGALGDFKAKDVGGYQVRSTPYPNGHLLLHDEDGDNDIFILVTGKDGSYILQGWTIGRHGKLDKYLRKNIKRPCYFVPQMQLYPMMILPEDPDEFKT